MDLLTHALSGAVVGAAMAPDDDHRVPFMVAGAAASLLPDLDALAGRAGPAAAWRHHRVALHGLPAAPILALAVCGVAAGGARLGLLPALPGGSLLLAATAAVLLHLLLDTLTSFGTALLYPLSRRRFSTHTHFIIDPALLGLSLWGVLAGEPGAALSLGGVAIVVVMAWRGCVQAGLHRSLRAVPGRVRSASVEPGPFSPFRWAVVARLTDGRQLVGTVAWAGAEAREVRVLGRRVPDSVFAAATRDPLVAAYLETVDFLHLEWIGEPDRPEALLVEDLKWRVHAGFRPLCLVTPWAGDGPAGPAREEPMFWRGPAPARTGDPVIPVSRG